MEEFYMEEPYAAHYEEKLLFHMNFLVATKM